MERIMKENSFFFFSTLNIKKIRGQKLYKYINNINIYYLI